MVRAHCGSGYRDPCIERDHPGLVGQKRIDIEFADFGNIGGKLRELDQRERDIVAPGRRDVAIALEDARHARSARSDRLQD